MDLLKVIMDLSYKPGWVFWLEGNTLVIKAEVLHSQTLKPVTFMIKRRIPRIAAQQEHLFLSWWEDILDEAEHHEMREFARYKGELIDDPHKSEPV